MPKLKYLSSLQKSEPKPVGIEPAPGYDIADALADPEKRRIYAKQLSADMYRRDLGAYIREMWHVTEPGIELEWNWHHELMCRVLQGMFEDWERTGNDHEFVQRIRNVIFNVPPGSLKSRIIAVGFPTWAWTRRPDMRFICLSVNIDAAARDARTSRTVIRSDWYQQTFEPDWQITDDNDAITNYGNSKHGFRLSRAQGSEIVGLRADCLAGESQIATELGNVSIQVLHERHQHGEYVPRVWSMNHDTNKPELKEILGTRVIRDREVVDIRTQSDNMLRCTDAHKIYSQGEYTQAAHLTGRTVSIMRGSNLSMRRLSYDTPQIQESAVLSVNQTTKDGSRIQIPVYDLHVAGNHNFFANGILVHNCILNDDPNNPKEAESKLIRDEVNDLWTTNIYNRVNHPRRSLRIGVQQRTHALDWTGYVTSTDGVWTPEDPDPDKWLVVAIPAEFEPERRCVTPWGKDPRKHPGQSIHRARMPKEWLAKEKFRFGSAKYAGQMQQRPALAGGGRVKSIWWNWFSLGGISERQDGVVVNARNDTTHYPRPAIRAPGNAPRPKGCNEERTREVGRNKYLNRWDFDWVYITVDPAVKKTVRGSNFGILVVGAQGMRRFILEDATQKGDIIEIVALLKQLTARWRPDKILIEEKAAGHDIMLMLREEIADGKVKDATGASISTVIEPINPGTADKEMRLDACIPQLEAGLVYLLEGSVWDEFINEFALFPNAPNDDRVDALSQLLNWAKSEGGYDLPSW